MLGMMPDKKKLVSTIVGKQDGSVEGAAPVETDDEVAMRSYAERMMSGIEMKQSKDILPALQGMFELMMAKYERDREKPDSFMEV